ncbi:MAG: sensor histidine kinase [Tissierellia bacterium]|nr:sensor histidine kinase [Tissierellia bacterium]
MEDIAANKDNKVARVNKILEDTINSIDNSKEEIMEIVEHARIECIKIEEELNEIKLKVEKVIEEVDLLDIEEKKSRAYLAKVSKNYNIYCEKDIKDAYDRANELRVQLLLKREEEIILRERRTEKELRLKSAIEVYEKSEKVGKFVRIASEYLKGNLDEILFTIDVLNKRQLLGIKVIEAQEEERRRIARDMHDGPAQSMANIVVKAELCEKLMDIDEKRSREELKDLKTIAKNTLDDIRKTIYNLRPMSLDDLGLIPTLERYIYNFNEEFWTNTELNIIGEIYELKPAIEVAVFRIIQESLNNIAKHSNANNAIVSIEFLPKKLNISITDDGVGFDVQKIAETSDYNNGGFGLISIRERVELLEGTLNIKTAPGFGTKLIISLPLIEEEE